MRIVASDYIDYWQKSFAAQRGLKSRFGVRVLDGRCWAIVQIADQEPSTFGKPQKLPVDVRSLPSYLSVLVDEDRRDCPDSDLVELLTGKKSLQEVLASPSKIEIKRMTASAYSLQLPQAS